MTDGELRGIVLEKFYELRHQKHFLELSDIASIDCGEQARIGNLCDQLGQHGLIEWKPLYGRHGLIDGNGSITAPGVDVVEGTASAPITVTLHDERISVSSSSNVQIGNSNTQGVNLKHRKAHCSRRSFERFRSGEEGGQIPARTNSTNPLVQKILAAMLSGGAAN